MIKAVIFDMFETLVTHFESPLYMGKQISDDIGISEEKFREIWNTSDDDRTLGKRTFEDVIEEILKVNNCYIAELFEHIVMRRKRSKIECFEHIHPEIIPLFESLKEKNIKIGLITNCYFEERDVIKESILFDYFDSVFMSCEVGLKKPDIEIFQRCMIDLEVEPEECLYVGDGGSFELETAKSLGMHPLQATWYLKDGANQPAKRKKEFTEVASPLAVISEMKVYERKKMSSLLKSTLNTRALPIGGMRYIRSDAPLLLTEEEVKWLIDNNITTLVDLRSDEELERKPCLLKELEGFTYYHLPVSGGGDTPTSRAHLYETYCGMADEQMDIILETILGAPTNVLYFCTAGKDRTGVVSALLLKKLGADEKTIVKDYMESKENLWEMLTTYVQNHPEVDLDIIVPREENIRKVLEMV